MGAVASELFKTLLSTLLFGRFARCVYPITNFKKYDIVTLVECFLAKLIIPSYIMNKEYMIAIDNYIFKHFLTVVNGYSGDDNGLGALTGYLKTDINYLHSGLQFVSKGRNVLKAFLLNWADGGTKVLKERDPKFAKFFHSKFLYQHPYGFDFLASSNVFYPQLHNFISLVSLISKPKFFQPKAFDDERSFKRQMRELDGRKLSLNAIAKKIDEAMSTLSVSGFTYPGNHVFHNIILGDDELEPMDGHLKKGQLLNYTLTIEATDASVKALDPDVLFHPLHAWNYMDELKEREEFIKSIYTEDYFKNSDKYEFIFSSTGRLFSSSYDSVLKKYLIDTYGRGQKLPITNQVTLMGSDRKLFNKLIEDNRKYFGYVEDFYFMTKPDVLGREYQSENNQGVFSKIYCFDTKKPHSLVVWDQELIMKKLISHTFTVDVKKAIDAGKVIHFKGIKTSISTEEFGLSENFSQDSPIKLNGKIPLLYGNITVFYQLYEKVKRAVELKATFPSFPRFVISDQDLPFLDFKVKDALLLPGVIESFTKNLKFLTASDYITSFTVANQ